MRRGIVLSLILGLGCVTEFEGDEPGECSDGADNDRDRAFDCADPDCVGAAVCLGEEDTDEGEVTDDPGIDVDTDVGVDTDGVPTCGDWDGQGDRPPGPHASEVVPKVSAWQQLQATVDSSYGPSCANLSDPDWADVFDPPDYDPGDFVYVFLEVQDDCTVAQDMQCGGRFPDDCVDDDIVWVIEDHVAVAEQDPVTEPFDPLTAPGCSITQQTIATLVDDGQTGSLAFEITLTMTPSCPAEVAANNGCVFTHTYDLEWVRAE